MRCVRLIQQDGQFAEHGSRLRHSSDLDILLYDHNRALPEDQQPAGPRTSGEHGLAGLVGCNWKGGQPFLEDCAVRKRGHGTARWLCSAFFAYDLSTFGGSPELRVAQRAVPECLGSEHSARFKLARPRSLDLTLASEFASRRAGI